MGAMTSSSCCLLIAIAILAVSLAVANPDPSHHPEFVDEAKAAETIVKDLKSASNSISWHEFPNRATSTYSFNIEGLLIFPDPKHDDVTVILYPWWNGEIIGQVIRQALGSEAAPTSSDAFTLSADQLYECFDQAIFKFQEENPGRKLLTYSSPITPQLPALTETDAKSRKISPSPPSEETADSWSIRVRITVTVSVVSVLGAIACAVYYLLKHCTRSADSTPSVGSTMVIHNSNILVVQSSVSEVWNRSSIGSRCEHCECRN